MFPKCSTFTPELAQESGNDSWKQGVLMLLQEMSRAGNAMPEERRSHYPI